MRLGPDLPGAWYASTPGNVRSGLSVPRGVFLLHSFQTRAGIEREGPATLRELEDLLNSSGPWTT